MDPKILKYQLYTILQLKIGVAEQSQNRKGFSVSGEISENVKIFPDPIKQLVNSLETHTVPTINACTCKQAGVLALT